MGIGLPYGKHRMQKAVLIILSAIVIVCCSCTPIVQNDSAAPLNVGDPAPALFISDWLKGKPVQKYKKGTVYVVEFWATWCIPCKAAMPHLSELARKHKVDVTFIGVDVMEQKNTSLEDVKAFVDSMGNNMDYLVAVQDSNLMERNWMESAKERGIPKTFVIDKTGKLAWIGHPGKLEDVLTQILNDNWDLQAIRNKRNEDTYLKVLEDSLIWEFSLSKYKGDRLNADDPGSPDSLLAVVDRIITLEPRLKYTPRMAIYTFSALLKVDQQRAYEYAKMAMVTTTYDEPVYSIIGRKISYELEKQKFISKIYRLGAEAYQLEIDNLVYPELVDISKLYSEMGLLYWLSDDNQDAIAAQRKAIEALKEQKDFEKRILDSLESRLHMMLAL